MIEYIIKRDGSLEKFSPNKLNKLSRWASDTLNPGEDSVDWSYIALQAIKQLHDRCSTDDIMNALISVCLAEKKETYLFAAGKLLTGVLYKNVFENNTPPPLKEYLEDMIDKDLYLDFLDMYSEEEVDEIDSFIDHSKDFTLSHAQVKKAMDSYLLKDKTQDIIYESVQFMCIRIAMAIAAEEENKVEVVKKLYTYFSNFNLCLPTPIWVNTGSPNKVGTSCLLYSVEDTLGSLGAGDVISYDMTTDGAGIGSVMFTRSKGAPIDKGRMRHGGKIPYYNLLASIIKATLQGERGGAATTYINCLDPEIEVLMHLRNPVSIPENQEQGIDYSFSFNNTFAEKYAKNEDWMLIDYSVAPDLWKAMYDKTTDRFERLFEEYYNDPDVPKKIVKARALITAVVKEAMSTGRLYEFNTTNTNSHTAYLDPIYSSNLCVHPETPLLTKELGYVSIKEVVDTEVSVWNGEDWSEVTPKLTGYDKTLYNVVVEVYSVKDDVKDFDVVNIMCTPEHVWYDNEGNRKETQELVPYEWLQNYTLPGGTDCVAQVMSIERIEGLHDTYCLTEPVHNKVIFNKVLTGNCGEIVAPTKPFGHRRELDKPVYEEGDGWVQTCTLCAIVLNKDYTDEEYSDLSYWALKIIDYIIDNSDFKLPQIRDTAKKWRTAGVSVINLAHDLARKGYNYSSKDSYKYIHNVFERHEYMLLRASLAISKERGLAEWINKTKYPDGYIPLDDYNKNVDSLADFEYLYDWQQLKQDIKDNGGIAHTALSCEVPSESSSILANCTNSVYPVRGRWVVKSGASKVYRFMPPDFDNLDYAIAYDTSTTDMTNIYAIMQKFLSQTISADYYHRLESTGNSLSTKELLKDVLYRAKMGVKTKYYTNTSTQPKDNLDFLEGKEETEKGCSGGSCTI